MFLIVIPAWVATFQDVGKYMRERMHGSVSSTIKGNTISVNLTHTLDKKLYTLPLTLKTYVPSRWTSATVKDGSNETGLPVKKDKTGTYVLYHARPNTNPILLSEGNSKQ